jgi:hypothetical protein
MIFPLEKYVPLFLPIFDRFGNLHRLRDLSLETIIKSEVAHGLVFSRFANDE